MIATALRLKIGVTGTLGIALFAAAELIANAYGRPDLTWVLRGMAVAIFSESLMIPSRLRSWRKEGRRSHSVWPFMESSVGTAASIALVLLGAGLWARLSGERSATWWDSPARCC